VSEFEYFVCPVCFLYKAKIQEEMETLFGKLKL
jgi:hypothetical protein